MASPLVPSPLSFDVPVPEVIITRRTRTDSVTGKIDQVVLEGKVRLFCRSKGHGFIDPKEGGDPVFMHISDIEGEYIPRKGDTVSYQLCPMPPHANKFQAVHIQIKDFTPEVHHKWSEKETPEEIMEDQKAEEEEKELLKKKKAPLDV